MEAIKWRKVLITGSTGFIGANIVRRFLKIGAEVYILTRTTSNKWRINDVLKDVTEYCVDLLNYEKIEAIILDIKPEIIFHTAIYGGYPFQQDIKKIIESNFIATVNLVNACKKVDFELFVNTGSSSEYGIKSKPMMEEDILEPVGDYGVSKAAATLYCQAVARREKIPVVTLRLFSPYGYYEEPTRLIPAVVTSCLKGRNPEVSSPNSVRDFIFIEDVVNAYVSLINSTKTFTGEIINIGFGQQHTVGYIVKTITDYMNYEGKISWGTNAVLSYDSTKWQAEIIKAQKVLKWELNYSIKDGLIKTIEWFKNNINFYL